jgi:hypothetical protein
VERLPRVFVSMGTPYTENYTRFRDELETLLRNSCGVDPRIIGKNEFPSGSPLAHIRAVMRQCAGVIIVAYERKYVETGMERRGGDGATKVEKRTYTTPWNHVESAIAYSLELPLYIFCQNGLSEEGLIESKVDWYIQHIDMVPGALSKPELVESIRAWVNTRVVPRSNKSSILRSLQGHVKFSEMTPHEIWTFFGIIAAAFLAGAVLSSKFPTLNELLHVVHIVH